MSKYVQLAKWGVVQQLNVFHQLYDRIGCIAISMFSIESLSLGRLRLEAVCLFIHLECPFILTLWTIAGSSAHPWLFTWDKSNRKWGAPTLQHYRSCQVMGYRVIQYAWPRYQCGGRLCPGQAIQCTVMSQYEQDIPEITVHLSATFNPVEFLLTDVIIMCHTRATCCL